MSKSAPGQVGADRRRVATWAITRLQVVALLLVIGLVAWTIAIFWFESAPHAILDTSTYAAVESAGTLALLFGALALFLFPESDRGDRMRWVASALAILAVGGIVFTFLFQQFPNTFAANERLFASLFIRTSAALLMLLGLGTVACPRFTGRRFIFAIAVITALGGSLLLPALPSPLLTEARLSELLHAPPAENLSSFSVWHWILSLISFAIVILLLLRLPAVAMNQRLRSILTIGLILLAGSHVHNMIWPSIYSPVVTTADVLRIGFAGTLLFGAILGMHEVARERAASVAQEREYGRRLRELQSLRADFSRMVAHELGNPLAAIRRYADILGYDEIDQGERQRMLKGIQHEADVLRTLIADVHTASIVEQDTFSINPRAVPMHQILSEIQGFSDTLTDTHVELSSDCPETQVSADPERIAQVMRNLLTNAVKFSKPGAAVHVTAVRHSDRVRIAVQDKGPGIRRADQKRIFEKFARGSSEEPKTPGLGLGLYISQRILSLHGTSLAVDSTPGKGTTFRFELPVVN